MTRCGPHALALVGLRCTGKSTVGALVARRAGCRFVDLDEEVAAAAGLANAGEVIDTLGLQDFREREEAALERALVRHDASRVVIATGGGAIESEASRVTLSRSAFTVWLRAGPRLLADRMEADPTFRPRLVGDSALAEILALDARRAPLYRGAARRAVDVDGREPYELATWIFTAWGGH